ncbi:MAG: penicillin-binding transpeptidase domain-containing protein [bacterium]|nr:penicillin-binding transpeptidase domain-containing protein [bacterium]MDZ4231576.1 penicillin-binding transpeptidase domain-containing protein [Patescibacteria group bacterium]
MARKRYRNSKIDLDEVISDSMSQSEFSLVESPIGQRVFYWLLIASVAVFAIVFLRVGYMSVVKGQAYKTRSQDNLHQTIPLIAPRGDITDRHGEPLVRNQPVFSVFLQIDQMVKNNEQEAVLKATHDILGVGEDKVIKLIQDTNLEDVSDIIIATDITRDQVLAVESQGLKSLNVEQSFKREYLGVALSHIVGYTGLVSDEDLEHNDKLVLNDNIGRGGLELYYDDLLRGENGRVTILSNSTGEVAEVLRTKDPIPGNALKTTIDKELQEYFYTRMISGLVSLGRTSGVGLAIDPRNGEVLALLSFPSYDGNEVGDYLTDPNRPLFNRAVAGVYNPGSTIKPLHAVAALNEGIVSPNSQFYSAGFIEIPNPFNPSLPSRFVDWKAHGWVNVYSALARSSNVYFYIIGGGFQDQIGLGIERLGEYWRKFGLGQPTGIDLPGESSGFLPDPEEKEERTGDIWRVGDTYNVSIGQGDLAITPLRLLSAIAAIGNGGIAYVPHLSLESGPRVLLDITDMGSALLEVRRGLKDAATKEYGTANLLLEVPMDIGAKTGSAQVSGNTKTNALIIAYGARDEVSPPEIAILVLVEDAREGSLNTVPIARDVLRWYYEHRIQDSVQEES